MRTFERIKLVVVLSGVSFGQPTEAPPRFEIADIHASPHTTSPISVMRGGFLRGNRYEIRNANMVDLIKTAYGVDADKVLGGPGWLEADRFDLIAKAPTGTPPETVKLMLQALLADRFKLMIHRETKLLPSYALTVGKGKPKLKEADGSGDTGCKNTIQMPTQGGEPTVPTISYTCHNITMAVFAAGVGRMLAATLFVGNNPILDQTGLTGSWDFDFKYSVPYRPLAGAAPAATTTFVDALDKQLGLKLEPIKAPTPVIVVDSVNRKPTDNLPGVTQSLPVLPTEFEVADVRPSAPDFRKGSSLQIQPGGRVNLRGMTLKNLIQQAWRVTDETLVGAPKWLDMDRFDIIAKADAGTDFDSIWPMVRSLLVERFKLATHMEDRPVSAYTLMSVKPKLKLADPSNRTGCKEGPGPDGKDPREANPALSRLITCQNMSMAEFAERLQSLASGYVHNQVLDATGIDGAWDFTLSFSPFGLVRNGAGAGGRAGDSGTAASGAPAASDPGGGISVFDALNKQLGLKLEMQKRPMPVLVIDHIEPKPTDN